MCVVLFYFFSSRGQQGAVHRGAGEPGEQSPDPGQQRGLHWLPEPGCVHQGGHGSLQKPGKKKKKDFRKVKNLKG